MRKEITMTIPEFLNMRKNKTSKVPSLKKCLNSCTTILTILIVFSTQIPIQTPINNSNVEIAKESFKVLYVLTAVGLECIYDLAIGIASAL